MKQKGSFIFITILTIVISLIKVNDKNFGKNGNFGLIDWDNFGYYLYLPATFIYEDLKLQDSKWVEEAQRRYELSSNFYQAHWLANGNRVIQYTAGMAIIYSPAFFAGHAVAKLSTKHPADGFSSPYQIAILIESILLVFLGLFYLRKVTLLFFNEKLSILIIAIICLGTNYFQIASANISSPHVLLFALYAVLFYLIIKWHEGPSLQKSILIGVLSAIMILSRPNELLFLLIPVLWRGSFFENFQSKLRFLIKEPKHLLALVLPLVLFGVLQPLYWHYTTGEWLFDSYKNEDFKFFNPYLTEYLWSYKKGWLLYTPIMALGILGFIPLVRKNKKLGIPLLCFFLLNLWVLSSWDCWWYADSFSQRSIVQSYIIFVLPVGYLLKLVHEKFRFLRLSFGTLVVLLIGFNLFQTYQFAKDILHSKWMTKEYYWASFGDLKSDLKKKKLLDIDRSINYLPEQKLPKHKLVYTTNFIDNVVDSTAIKNNKYSSEGSLILTKDQPKSKKIRLAYKDICDSSYAYIITRMRFKSDHEAKENPFGIEFNMIDSYNGKGYGYSYRGVEHISWFQKGTWVSMDLVVIPPLLRNKDDSIQINLVLKGEHNVEIDRLSIEVLDPSTSPKVNSKTFYNDYHTLTKGDWSKKESLVGEKGYELIDFSDQFSSTLSIKLKEDELFNDYSGEVSIFPLGPLSDVYIVVSIVGEKGENIFYESVPIELDAVGWVKLPFSGTIPPASLNSKGELKLYLWSKSQIGLMIRDMKLKISES